MDEDEHEGEEDVDDEDEEEEESEEETEDDNEPSLNGHSGRVNGTGSALGIASSDFGESDQGLSHSCQ